MRVLTTALCAFCCVLSFARTPLFGRDSIADIVGAMTTEEKVNLVVGTMRDYVYWPEAAPGMPVREQGQINDDRGATAYSEGRVPGAAGDSYPVPRLGIPAIVMADGPAGVRIDPTRTGTDQTFFCTAFPAGSLLSSTWDVDLVQEVGSAIGNEALHYGVDILLAPGTNIMRNPLCGRNFEYYSEDPLLAGKTAAAYVKGVQSAGVGATIKHFAANNQETMRNGIDVVVSDRALRKIYLEPFRIVITEAKPMAVMSAYNKVNGQIMPENKYLLTDILRGEWGFDGFVMTDWWAEGNGALQLAAGNDMLMPGTWRQYDEIIEALENGSLSEETLNLCVADILRAFEKTPAGARRRYDDNPDLDSHAALARRSAAEGMVLLENRDKTLPLAPEKKIALFGHASYDTFVGGTGSGNVNRAYKVNIDEGLAAGGYGVDTVLQAAYRRHISDAKDSLPPDNVWSISVIPELALSDSLVAEAANRCDVAVLTISRMAGESADRTLSDGDWFLSAVEKANLDKIAEAFHSRGKKLVVLLNMGSIVDMADWHTTPDAILHVWLPGQEAGNAVADIVAGVVNPSGCLPMTIARRYEDYGSAANFPHSENIATVYYTDDIYVGYRHFNHKNISPLYAFGHGLSYTDFTEEIITDNDNPEAVKIKVTNTGTTPGKRVVMLFDRNNELKSFVKTRLLNPGESQTF